MSKDRKCLVCGYVGEFGSIIPISSNGHGGLIGRMPDPIGYVGSVLMSVCPSCGVVTSTVRNTVGTIKLKVKP